MLVRKVKEKDLFDLALLYEKLAEEKSDIEIMKEKFCLIDNNPDYFLAGAEEDGKIVGTATGIFCNNMMSNCHSFLVIEAFIVNEDYRRRGVGKSILLELENWGKSLGCSYIILVSGEERKEAHMLYEKLGYGEDRARGFRKILV